MILIVCFRMNHTNINFHGQLIQIMEFTKKIDVFSNALVTYSILLTVQVQSLPQKKSFQN